MAYLFLGIYYNVSVWFKITDKTYFGTVITVGGAVLTMVLNYFFIPLAGYTGSSWAAFLVYLLMAVACYLLGQRYYPIPYKVFSDFSYIAVTAVLIFLISKVTLANLWLSFGFHTGVMVIFVASIYLLENKNGRTIVS